MLATPVSRPRFAASAVLVLTLLFASAVATAADEVSPRLLLDAGSGRVLQQQATGRLWYPASLTKLMTLYLAFEALADGRLSLDQSLPVSKRAAAQPAVKLGLRAGGSLSVEQAIQALATISSNDVAVVLAEALAGTEAAFADRMTQQAAAFGMLDTRFRNASGLPDPGQVTTARDMAILAQRLYRDFPQRMALFSARSFAFNGHRHGSHNPLLGGYPGADGLKTGFTCDSGYNMVATATRDDRRLVAVVLGATSRASRDRQVRALLDSGFAAADTAAVLPALSDLPARISRDLPPPRLAPGVCSTGVASESRSVWPIESWGVLLGIYPGKADARRAVRRAQSQLGGLPSGRALLLERQMEGGTSWKVLLIGYGRDNVGKICLRLWARDLECVAQPPFMLNLPGYSKR